MPNGPAATGPVLLRADSGFWSGKVFARLARAGWQFSIGVRMQPMCARRSSRSTRLPGRPWMTTRPPRSPRSPRPVLGDYRLIVRRVRTLNAQGELLPSWEHFPFATNRTEPIQLVEAEHRQHAVVELVIRDLKDQALTHFPSGQFHANSAWTVIAALAHNLLRWTEVIGLGAPAVRTARTLRRRLLAIELYPEVVDGDEEEGGVPSRLIKTDRRKAEKEGTPWQMFAGSPSGRTTRIRSRSMISLVRALAG